MYKIMITVRNRLGITKKCLRALYLHSKHKHQIYIYDNQTDHRLDEHFALYNKLLRQKRVAQVTFNTKQSTFNAFSKAVACNSFGKLHEMDPNKQKTRFLVFLDNDIIVTPGWDDILFKAWHDVDRHRLNNVKIIGQRPGGIKHIKKINEKIGGYSAIVGRLGGSALWCVRPNFFTDVGYLSLAQLVNLNKKHDQLYWKQLNVAAKGEQYILGLDCKLGIHCGAIAGSVCNALTKNRANEITFEEADNRIEGMNFDQFYKMIKDDKRLHKDW